MATYQVVYKNHCTPQEQIKSGGRFYLDSDCRRKLTGTASVTVSGAPGDTDSDVGTYSSSTSVSISAVQIAATGSDFIYVKNTGTDSVDLLLALDNALWYTVLSDGEAFASKITTTADVRVKTASGTTTIEYLRLT